MNDAERIVRNAIRFHNARNPEKSCPLCHNPQDSMDHRYGCLARKVEIPDADDAEDRVVAV